MMMDSAQIREVVEATVKEVGRQPVGIKVARPVTLQGWFYVLGACVGAAVIVWKSFSLIHVVTKHHEAPYHPGSEVLIGGIKEAVVEHKESNIHMIESEIEVKIIRQTEPMKQDIQQIQQDVGAIRARVDILLERDDRR